jgi:hypothetical protein
MIASSYLSCGINVGKRVFGKTRKISVIKKFYPPQGEGEGRNGKGGMT